MENLENGSIKKKEHSTIVTFTVPLSFLNVYRDTEINTKFFNKSSKRKLIEEDLKLTSTEKILEAKIYVESCIKKGICDPLLFFNYGFILKKMGKLKEAKKYLNKSIQLNPDFAEAYTNLSNLLIELDSLHEAEKSIRKAIKLKPFLSESHATLGVILRTLDRLDEAEVHARKAIKLKPTNLNALLNLGNILKDLGKLEQAEIYIRKAIQIDPKSAEAYFNLATIELFQGNYESGFKHYEFRHIKNKPNFPHANPRIKKITNQEINAEEKLLVISEQGLGDTLQYMRYIPLLRARNIDFSFCAQTKLHKLIKISKIDENPLTTEQANKVSEGKWISLLSLPNYLKINPISQGNYQPYIKSKDELITKWKRILSAEKKPIIGINWQGNISMEKRTYKGRSIPLETFSKIINKNEISFLSLQKGFGSEQLDHCSFKNKFVRCQDQINSAWDFLENAAIIENCDLIITCDTSIAHLAGGMGKKVWLLLKKVPFWTWGVEGESTFWYPSMRLFRQKEKNNWQEVMQRVADTLYKEFRNRV
ncbi:tetratricopeptide repeat protein [Prochlorococcus sp. MIT 0916]|uniref:tetratricopeptide repeat protein n=1 Tax=Prochlorococcus sp. MIT 0916 TaxID=3082521 RepID=UPI0039B3DFEC